MSKIDRIVAYYTQNLKLTTTQDEYRKLLEEAHRLHVNGKTRLQISKILEKSHGIQKTKAYKAINDALQVFGDINKSSAEGMRHMQTERYTKIYRDLMKKGKYELAMMALSRIDKINHLEKARAAGNTKNVQPVAIIFTTDPAALAMQREREIREAEDIDHEEV